VTAPLCPCGAKTLPQTIEQRGFWRCPCCNALTAQLPPAPLVQGGQGRSADELCPVPAETIDALQSVALMALAGIVAGFFAANFLTHC